MTEHLGEFEGGPLHNQVRSIGDTALETFVTKSYDEIDEAIVITEHTYARDVKPRMVRPTSTLWRYVYHGSKTVDA